MGTREEDHRISKCEKCDVYAGPDQHTLNCCRNPMNNGKDTVHECAIYPTAGGAAEHHLRSCAKFPGPTLPSMHSISKDVSRRVASIANDHKLSNCSPPSRMDTTGTTSNSVESSYASRGAMQWIRDILKHPETYDTKFTKLPGKDTTSHQSSLVRRRTSEPARILDDSSLKPNDKETNVDGNGFKHVVNEFQRLLDEAMAITCQIIDQPQQAVPRESTVHSKSDTMQSGHGPAAMRNNRYGQDLATRNRHARYNDPDIAVKTRSSTYPALPKPSLIIPHRGSSRQHIGCWLPYEPCCNDNELIDFEPHLVERGNGPSDLGGKSPYQLHDVQLSGDDTLPERDVAGRQMQHDHVINLRNRSHVSLKGIQGFSLARSHKRQPIARD